MPPQSHAAIRIARKYQRNSYVEGGGVMTIVRPDKPALAKLDLEKFARPDRPTSKEPTDVESIAFLHRQRGEPPPASDLAAGHLNEIIRRIAGVSMEEIDRVIRKLESVRDVLDSEGERVRREIASYASLNHASKSAMKIIGDSLHQWNDAPDK